ncbi:MAG: nitrate ABC transporter permease [Oscillospiraceae bacterium]
MKDFTTKNKQKLQMLFAILFWIAIWQGASMLIGQSLLLASPFSAFTALLRLFTTNEFWLSVAHSFLRIVSGFLLGLIVGLLLAVFSAAVSMVRILLAPFMLTVRSVPVASFIILALLWLKNAGNLAVLISFLMVLPVVYGNVLEGIINTDKKLLQMAKVYNMPFYKRFLYIYLSARCAAVFCFCLHGGSWDLLEKRSCRRGNRHHRKQHWRRPIQCKAVLRHRRGACVDGGNCAFKLCL